MPSVTETIVDFVEGIQYSDLSPEAVHEAKRNFLDAVACALCAHESDKGRRATELASRSKAPGEATVLGLPGKVPLNQAAFANAELINALDYDAVLVPGHVTPFVLPAPLALGEKKECSGQELILSIVLGHEIAARMGLALRGQRKFIREGPDAGKVGFSEVHGHSSTIFGGTAACARMQGLKGERIAHALGIAGHICPVPSFMKWAMVGPQTTGKYLLAGWMAEAELTAVSLADAGYLGDTIVLESDYGFWKFYGSDKWNPKVLTARLGEEWQFVRTAYKPYPCCQMMHTGLDCFYHIIDQNRLEPGEIEEVKILLDPITEKPIWRVKKLQSDIDTQFSVPYVFAVAAYRVKIGPEWQAKTTRENTDILRFMDKVKHGAHPEYDQVMLQEPGSNLARVEVRARGKVFAEERKWMKGSPAKTETRMSDRELQAKFRDCAARTLPPGRVSQVESLILELDKLMRISGLMEKLVP